MPKEVEKETEKLIISENLEPKEDLEIDDTDFGPQITTSINENLKNLIDDNPNKLIGCGG